MRGWATVPLLVLAVALAAEARPLADRDGDGLPDAWELHGVTIDGGAGPRFIDLPAMGVDECLGVQAERAPGLLA